MTEKAVQPNVCPRCKGSGKCIDCQGTGRTTCPDCSGKGNKTAPSGRVSPCKTCQGTGSISCPTECPSCGGSGIISRELQISVQKKYLLTAGLTTFRPQIVVAIILVTVFFYLLCSSDLPSLLPDFSKYILVKLMVGQPGALADLEWWRFFTPLLLHANLFHLACNMYVLWVMGSPLEELLGKPRFLFLYLFSGLMGNIFSWLLNPAPGIGASTAVMGVGAAYLALHWRWKYFNAYEIKRTAFAVVGLLVFGMIMSGLFRLPIDNMGHLGGALGGLVFVYLLPKKP